MKVLLLLFAIRCISLFILGFGSSSVRGEIIGSFKDGYPGSGYGCDRKCDDGDVNYVIRASLETYAIPGTETLGTVNVSDDSDVDFIKTSANATISMFTRTFTGVANESTSSFCFGGDDGTNGPLAPCLQVLPGQKMKIKVINYMADGMTLLKQHKTKLLEYWNLAVEPGQPNLDVSGVSKLYKMTTHSLKNHICST